MVSQIYKKELQSIPKLTGDDRGKELESEQEWLSKEMLPDSPNPNSDDKTRNTGDDVQNPEGRDFVIEESDPIKEAQFKSKRKIKNL